MRINLTVIKRIRLPLNDPLIGPLMTGETNTEYIASKTVEVFSKENPWV